MARGGSRQGAGRPKTDSKSVMIRLSQDEHRKLQILGGSAFIKKMLQETEMNAYQTIKLALETAELSDEAKDVILTIIDGNEDDEEYEVKDYRESLEDGECLASFGFDDEDAVDEAHSFLEKIEFGE